MKRLNFTGLPILAAMIVAIAHMPTNVYNFSKREVGTLDTEPWRIKGESAVARTIKGFMAAFRVVTRYALPITAVLLIAVALATQDAGAVALAVGPAANIKVLRQRAAEFHQQMVALNDKVVAENRPMTEAETTQLTDLKAKMAANKTQLDLAEELSAQERSMTPVADADANASAAAAAAAGQNTAPRIEVVDMTKKLGYFGHQLHLCRKFAVDQNALTKSEREVLSPMMPLAAATGLNTDVPSEGGFIVAPERSSTILQRTYTTGQILSRVFRMPIGAGSNGMKIPAIDETSRADSSRYGGIVSGWLGQGNTLTSGKPKFREMDMKLRKVGAFVYATDEMLADAVALEAWINRYLPLELAFRTEDACVNGDGSNKPLGILNSGCVITVTRTTANRVKYEDVSAMWSRMWAGARANSVWICDQSVETQLEQMLIPGTTDAPVGQGIYRPAGSRVGQVYGELYGRPVIPVEYCAALGTSGDIVLANFDEYVVIDKGGVEQAVSLHVAFLTAEAVYRFMYRVDGQHSWNAALTPKNGGSTLSPVIVLS